MDIRDVPKVVILICAVVFVTAGTEQDERSLGAQGVGTDGNPDGAKQDDTVVTPAKDGDYKLSYADYEMTWRNFKLEHGKTYSSISEEKRRFAIFMDNVKAIEAHNMKYHLGQSSYWTDINRFSDWTQEEFGKWLRPQRDNVHLRSKRSIRKLFEYTFEEVPDEIDWSKKPGYDTPVLYQGNCGSCYAFSTTAAVEAQVFRHTHKSVNLSEQQILDCSMKYGNSKCAGGYVTKSFEYIIKEGGLESESTYPYKAKNGSCNFEMSKVVAEISSYYHISPSEEMLRKAVGTKGPVSAAIFVKCGNFMNFKEGIFDDQACYGWNDPDHEVLVVGYGRSEKEKKITGLLRTAGEKTDMIMATSRFARNKGSYCGHV